MKVARVVQPLQVRFEDVAKPAIEADQVLLKVLCFGVCASDMQIYHGKHKYAAMPVIMGHELAAIVAAVGADVSGFKIGDKVTVEPQVSCGECFPCVTGRFNVCEKLKVMGVHMDGFNAEYVVCDPKLLHHAPQDMDPELLALAEPLAVGVGSIKRSKRFKGGNVCVVGAGTIGNFVAQAAKGLGAGQVLVTDLNDDKLAYALECGIDYAVNTREKSLQEAIEDSFGTRKCDVIVDCVAIPAVFKQIVAAARPDSDIILTGNYKEPVEFEVPMIQRREINLLGHMMYVREDFEDAIKLLYEGKIRVDRTISKRYDFADYQAALDYIDEHPLDVMKIMIKIADE